VTVYNVESGLALANPMLTLTLTTLMLEFGTAFQSFAHI